MTVPDLPGGTTTLLFRYKQFSGATRYTFHYRLAATLRFLLENQPFSAIWAPYLAFLVCGCVRPGPMGNAAKNQQKTPKSMVMTVPDLPGGAATLLSHCKQFSGATRYSSRYRLAATLRFLLENLSFSAIWTPYLAL